ncbi:MAG: iron-containing alcohol dehydrogenase [Treponema sp.]|jgi:alcohol dehydrogenase class IV|nr:iron-containing alcohol dehydrogenase [Treponema sp.]
MKVNYLMPTRIIMGENCLSANRKLLAGLGKKGMIMTGPKSAKTNGSLDDTVRALSENGQAYALFDRVMNNPTDICVFEAARSIKAGGCDFVIALGGGSPMDAAKAAAVLALNDISKEELFGLKFTGALPLAAVPTTAGTGSETTPYSVLVDTTGPDGKSPREGGPAKRSFGSPSTFPRFAFLDARYMRTLGRDLTVHTAIDALSHAVEGMLTLRADRLSDALAAEALALLGACYEGLLNFPAVPGEFPTEIREKLLLASCIAGMVISQSGTAAPHSMGYHFTLNWGTDHGRANGLLMKPFLRWCREKEGASPVKPRIPALCAALGMELEEFFGILEKLLGKRERAAPAELEAWSAQKMKNAANTYLQPDQGEILRIFREAVG